MIVQADGTYKASTTRGTTAEGQLTEDSGKTTITITPNDPSYRTGSARYEKVN